MAGVQVQAPALNDENSSLAGVTQLKPTAPLQPVKQGSALKSARKAFGTISANIANSGQHKLGDASTSKQQLDKPARRAFGDISNSAAKPSAVKPPAGPTATAKKATSSLFAAVPTAVKAAPAAPSSDAAPAGGKVRTSGPSTEQPCSKPAWWEGLEPELPAGRTWQQQVETEDAAVDAEAKRAADEIWQAVNRNGIGMFGFLLPSQAADSDGEDITGPTMEVPLRSFGGISNLSPLPDLQPEDLMFSSDCNFASLLPDIADVVMQAGTTEAAAGSEVHQLAEAVTALSTNIAVGPVMCSSPADVAASSMLQQRQGCKSPEVLPW